MSETVCTRCRQFKSEHWLANYSDGPHVGATTLICPSAIYSDDRAAAESREKAVQLAVGALARYGVHDYDCACAHEKCGTNPAIKHPPNCPNCDCGLRAALAAVRETTIGATTQEEP